MREWCRQAQVDAGEREGSLAVRLLADRVGLTEVTGLLDLSGWPQAMRVIVRREHPHPGAQLSLFEAGPAPVPRVRHHQVWVQLTAVAADLIVWLQMLADGDLAKAEPKLLRFRILQVPARLTRSSQRRHLRIPVGWPWSADIVDAFRRIMIIPAPT